MYEQLYHQFSGIDDTHWWNIYRRELVGDLLKNTSFPEKSKILDAGCGTGGNLRFLARYSSELYGLDLSETAISFARQKNPGASIISGDINNINNFYRPGFFNLITIFNVLYHVWVKNDYDVLKKIFDLLSPGGILILSEPAFRLLWRNHDLLDMGKTRYSRRELSGLLEQCGFKIECATCFNSPSFFPALALKIAEIFLPAPDPEKSQIKELEINGALISAAALYLLSFERKIIKKFRSIPIGTTLLIKARKPA